MKGKDLNQVINIKHIDKTKQGVYLLIVAIVVILTITVGALARGNIKGNRFTPRKLKGSPEQIVYKAILNTKEQLEQEKKLLQEKNGEKEFAQILEEPARNINFNLQIKTLDGMERAATINAITKNMVIEGDLAATKGGKYIRNDIGVKQGALELFKVAVYKRDQEYGVYSPKVLKNPYAVKGQTFFEDLKTSAIYGSIIGEDQDEGALERFKEALESANHMKGLMQTLKAQADTSPFNRENEHPFKGITFTKRENTETNDHSYECTLNSQQIASFTKKQLDYIKTLDFGEQVISDLARSLGLTKESFVEKLTGQGYDDEIALQFKIYTDEYFVRSVICTMMNATYDEEMFTFKLELSNEANLFDNIGWEIKTGEGFWLKVTDKHHLEEENDILKREMQIELTSYGEKGSLSYKTAHDLEAKEKGYNVDIQMNIPYLGTATIVGEGSKTIRDDQIIVDLTHLDCHLKDTSAKEINADLALQYGIRTILPEEAEFKSEEQVKYILELSEKELIAVLQKLQIYLQLIGIG